MYIFVKKLYFIIIIYYYRFLIKIFIIYYDIYIYIMNCTTTFNINKQNKIFQLKKYF